jgi:hypothetical protein
MEQATKGQMGQPAACMIENNAHLQTDKGCWIMAHPKGVSGRVDVKEEMFRTSFFQALPTKTVDNFVGKSPPRGWQAAPERDLNGMIKF